MDEKTKIIAEKTRNMEPDTCELFRDLYCEIAGLRASLRAMGDKLAEWVEEGDARERSVLREFAKSHLHYHVELDDMVTRAFFKTHPEVVRTMAECRTIIGMPVNPKDEAEDHHAFIDRIFDKDWDGSVKPKK